MKSAAYTLHLDAHAAPGDAHALDRADLVRDGFSWGAFLVPALWFVRHRHWWLALGALGIVFGLAGLLWGIGARPGAIVAAELILHALIGLEGASLRRWAYARRGRPVTDIVIAGSDAEAAVKAFGRWLAPADPGGAVRTPPPVPGFYGRSPEPVIGLFPDLEGRRP